MYERDATALRTFARINPVNTFRVLAFAVATANCPFMQSVEAMRFIVAQGANIETFEYSNLTVEVKSAGGMGLSPMKMSAYNYLYTHRESIYAKYLECLTLDNGHLTFWEYILDNLPGMGLVKAAFATQMLFGKLGCIDIHNTRALGLEKMPSGRSKKQRPVYLNIQSVKTSQAWWDDWCNFLAAKNPGIFRDGDHVSFLHQVAVIGG